MSQPKHPRDATRTRDEAEHLPKPSFDTQPFRAKRRRLTIGELARRVGIGVEAVRYYEKRGLLEQPSRPSRGFREYPEHAIERLDFVRRARTIGFSVDAIGDLLRRRTDHPDQDSCDEFRRTLGREIEEFDTSIRDLERRRQIVVALLHACEQEARKGPRCQTLEAFYLGTLGLHP